MFVWGFTLPQKKTVAQLDRGYATLLQWLLLAAGIVLPQKKRRQRDRKASAQEAHVEQKRSCDESNRYATFLSRHSVTEAARMPFFGKQTRRPWRFLSEALFVAVLSLSTFYSLARYLEPGKKRWLKDRRTRHYSTARVPNRATCRLIRLGVEKQSSRCGRAAPVGPRELGLLSRVICLISGAHLANWFLNYRVDSGRSRR